MLKPNCFLPGYIRKRRRKTWQHVCSIIGGGYNKGKYNFLIRCNTFHIIWCFSLYDVCVLVVFLVFDFVVFLWIYTLYKQHFILSLTLNILLCYQYSTRIGNGNPMPTVVWVPVHTSINNSWKHFSLLICKTTDS